jgi:hypothetical protein
MAENKTKSVESSRRFNFEDDKEDSNYLGVKRIVLTYIMDDYYEENIETNELLPNAQIQLTIICKQIDNDSSLLRIELYHKNTNELFNMEVGLQFFCPAQRRTEMKYFTTTQAKIAIVLAPFDQSSAFDNRRETMFEIVLKVPNDLNNSITEMPTSRYYLSLT